MVIFYHAKKIFFYCFPKKRVHIINQPPPPPPPLSEMRVKIRSNHDYVLLFFFFCLKSIFRSYNCESLKHRVAGPGLDWPKPDPTPPPLNKKRDLDQTLEKKNRSRSDPKKKPEADLKTALTFTLLLSKHFNEKSEWELRTKIRVFRLDPGPTKLKTRIRIRNNRIHNPALNNKGKYELHNLNMNTEK